MNKKLSYNERLKEESLRGNDYALDELKSNAGAGSAEAQYHLALFYARSNGGEHDPDYQYWIEKSKENGYVPGVGVVHTLTPEQLQKGMMRFGFDDIVICTFRGKTGRFNYLLSLLIVIIVFCFVFVYYNPDRCFVCNPVIGIPWSELITTSVMILLGGIYVCLLSCLLVIDESYLCGPVMIPILSTVFYLIQTIKRCHDIGESGWRFLIPIYSPLFLLFLPEEIDVDQEPERSSFLLLLWKVKWLILTLFVICLFFYCINQKYVHMHNVIYA